MPLDVHYAAIEREAAPDLTAQEIAWEQVQHWKASGVTPRDVMQVLFGVRRSLVGWDRVLAHVEREAAILIASKSPEEVADDRRHG